MNFSVLNERERGYIVGAFLGDGSRIVEKKSGHYGAKFCFDAKRDLEIASFLRKLFERSGKRVSLYEEETWLLLKVYSKKFLGFLSRFVEYVEYEGRKRKVLVGSEDWSRNFILGFVGGLIDADGYMDRNKGGPGHFGASITTMNYTFAKQLVSLFIRLGLKTKVNKIKPSQSTFSKRMTYMVRVQKAEFSKVCRGLLCIKHEQSGCRTKSF
jgi:DNA-binding transcriptional regulator WhiA